MACFHNARLTARAFLGLPFAGVLAVAAAHAQSTGKVNLPDPTPRDRDLHELYGDNPVLREQQQRAAALRRTRQRVQIVADANEILLLAQQMREHLVKHDDSAQAPPDAITARKIEALAKRVREEMQSQ
jgi:hypothetical protein